MSTTEVPLTRQAPGGTFRVAPHSLSPSLHESGASDSVQKRKLRPRNIWELEFCFCFVTAGNQTHSVTHLRL